MSHNVKIAPSLLACDLSRLGEEIRAVEKAGADLLHLDVMDGHFVPNLTMGIPVLESIRKVTKLPIDAHLMVENADKFIDDFKKAGCDWLSVHVEACPHIHRTLHRIKELGMKAGVAINPGTSLATLDGVLSEIDYVLVMSVNPGFGGQKFISQSFERLKQLKQKIGSHNVAIQIDGGIKKDNAAEVIRAGAEILVVGTGLFGQKDYAEAIKSLRHS
jgi:ribulose-phosphate 3-epimerase